MAGDTPTGYRIFNKTKSTYVGSEVNAVTSADDPNTVTVSFTPTLADGAGEYQVEAVYGSETLLSEPARLYLWEVEYSDGHTALTTSSDSLDGTGSYGTDAEPNDSARILIHKGYGGGYFSTGGDKSLTMDDGEAPPALDGLDLTCRTKWGSGEAMRKILFSVTPQGSLGADPLVLHLNLYNANAINQLRTGVITCGITLGKDEAHTVTGTYKVALRMEPAAINATLPLAVQSYGYGADGSVAVPTNYGIQNGSNFPIKVTGLTAKAAADFRLVDPSSFVEGADRTYKVNKNQMSHGQATLRLNDRQITTAAAGGSWTAGADFTGWAIKGAASEGAWVSYPIAIESYIAKGEDSTTGKQLAEVTYTVGVSPESVS